MSEKLEILQRDYKKQYNKYYEYMGYKILSVEIDALYNVLVLNVESEYDLIRRWEQNVKRILNIK